MDPSYFFFLKCCCLATGFAMHISGYPTMREIMVAGNTLNFHIAPYASGFLNQSVNMWYAYIRGDVPLMVHRMCGIAANTYYLSTYLAYSAPSKAADNKRWLMFVGGLLLSLAVYLHVLLPLSGSSHLYNSSIALAGALTGVALAAAPLATVREVLRTKDASSFPGTLVLMQFLQFTSWTIYGWVVTDWSTFANNLVGVVLGGLQLCLIAFYGNKRHASSSSSSTTPSPPSALPKGSSEEGAGGEEEGSAPVAEISTLLGKKSESGSESKHR